MPVTEYRPLNRRQREELEGYVATSTAMGRAVLFVFGVAIVGLVSRTVQATIAVWVPALTGGPWWLVPPLAAAVWLFHVARRWTGGREFREGVRKDIAGAVVAVRRISAVDAIEVQEAEDEGPAYFILTSDGQTLLVAFQELSRYRSRGFPWTEFELVEAPHSRTFFAIKKLGERLKPSSTRPPFTWEEVKAFGFDKYYQVLDLEFSRLKDQMPADGAG